MHSHDILVIFSRICGGAHPNCFSEEKGRSGKWRERSWRTEPSEYCKRSRGGHPTNQSKPHSENIMNRQSRGSSQEIETDREIERERTWRQLEMFALLCSNWNPPSSPDNFSISNNQNQRADNDPERPCADEGELRGSTERRNPRLILFREGTGGRSDGR
jgi:hypothetical protein